GAGPARVNESYQREGVCSPIQVRLVRPPDGMSDPLGTVRVFARSRFWGTADEAACDQIPELGREAEGFRAEAEGSAGRSAARSEEAAAEDAGARDDASARGPTQLAWQSQLSRHRRCVPRREGALRAAGDPLHRARE